MKCQLMRGCYHIPTGSVPEYRDYPLHEAVHRRRVGPPQHRDDVALGIDPGQVAAGAPRVVTRLGSVRVKGAPGIQPPQIAVLRVERTGLEHPLDPGFRENAPAPPHPASEQHQTYPRLVARRDEDAASPMAAARDGLHPPSVDLDPGVAVARPLPIGRGTDRVHDQLAEHLGQRAAPNPQQSQAQAVDPDVVVFPEPARPMEVAVSPLWRCTRPAGRGAVAVDKIGLVPQHTLPFRGLLQEVMPGDRVVVRRLETAILDRATDLLVRIADQSAIPGEPGEDREIAL